ncbi:hypothetical protein NP493_1460g00016 [Ridgeia piscesae]|uniref:PHD-type domain-containing protein n=1 Tax=Ridgeia piscesae TaxID=27915 RepID=A0AAD9K2U1_RIDPI|nr:hypothetical protein NP493_1460g00016 [Ridgeia piscesae]
MLLSDLLQSEISAVLHQPPPPPSSQKAAVKRHSEVLSTSTPVKPQQVTTVKTDGPTNQHLITSGAKKRKLISTGMKHSSTKLYCVCRTPYDDTKFYIGCDLCSNWFHGACVGINENRARRIDTYVCAECQRQKTNTSEELYCICQTPYDDTQ